MGKGGTHNNRRGARGPLLLRFFNDYEIPVAGAAAAHQLLCCVYDPATWAFVERCRSTFCVFRRACRISSMRRLIDAHNFFLLLWPLEEGFKKDMTFPQEDLFSSICPAPHTQYTVRSQTVCVWLGDGRMCRRDLRHAWMVKGLIQQGEQQSPRCAEENGIRTPELSHSDAWKGGKLLSIPGTGGFLPCPIRRNGAGTTLHAQEGERKTLDVAGGTLGRAAAAMMTISALFPASSPSPPYGMHAGRASYSRASLLFKSIPSGFVVLEFRGGEGRGLE